jgi:transposase-like protein
MPKQYTEEQKLEIILAALRNEASKADLCRQRGVAPMSLDAWINRFLEADKAGLRSSRADNGESVLDAVRKENATLKHELAERELDIRILKKVTGQL